VLYLTISLIREEIMTDKIVIMMMEKIKVRKEVGVLQENKIATLNPLRPGNIYESLIG
jgi:hypothetical protein